MCLRDLVHQPSINDNPLLCSFFYFVVKRKLYLPFKPSEKAKKEPHAFFIHTCSLLNEM